MTNEQKLRFALRANAASSIIFGSIGLILAGPVVDLLGAGSELIVRLLSLGLLGFAAFVLYAATLPLEKLRAEALLISAGDFGWVAGSVVLIALGLFSTAGVVVTGLIAALVLDFALAQLYTRAKTASV